MTVSHGESLSSALITELATTRPPPHSSFDHRSDLASVGCVHYPVLPVRLCSATVIRSQSNSRASGTPPVVAIDDADRNDRALLDGAELVWVADLPTADGRLCARIRAGLSPEPGCALTNICPSSPFADVYVPLIA